MKTELEIKLQLPTEAEITRTLRGCEEIYGPPKTVRVQLDEYFDTTDEQLKRQDLTVRLRTVEQIVWVAIKGPRVHLPSGAVDRIELEFRAASGDEVRRQLDFMGLKATAAIEKRRWTFGDKQQGVEIVIDQLPFIGGFMEVEGRDEQTIFKVVAELGLADYQPVRGNYTELLENHLVHLGLPLRPNLRATFDAESAFQDQRGT